MFWAWGKIKFQKKCIAIWNIEFASKKPYSFVFTFLSVHFNYIVMGPWILIKLINFWWSRLTALPVSTTIKWDCFENHFFALFLVICYEFSITRTPDNLHFFFDFLEGSSYQESTVLKCSKYLILCFETLKSRAILSNWRWLVGLCFQWQMKKKNVTKTTYSIPWHVLIATTECWHPWTVPW